MTPAFLALAATVTLSSADGGGPYDTTWIGPDAGGWWHVDANWSSTYAPYEGEARANFSSLASESNVWFATDPQIGGVRVFDGDWLFALGVRQLELLPLYPASHRSLEVGVLAGDDAWLTFFGGSVMGEHAVVGLTQGASGVLLINDSDVQFESASIGREGPGWLEISNAGELTVDEIEVAAATDAGTVQVRPGGALVADIARIGLFGDASFFVHGYAETETAHIGVYADSQSRAEVVNGGAWIAGTIWCGLEGTGTVKSRDASLLVADAIHVSDGSTLVAEFDGEILADTTLDVHAGGTLVVGDGLVDAPIVRAETDALISLVDSADGLLRAQTVRLDGAAVDASVGEILISSDLVGLQGFNLLVDGLAPSTLEIAGDASLVTDRGRIGTVGAGGQGAVTVLGGHWSSALDIIVGSIDDSSVEAILTVVEPGVVDTQALIVRVDGTLVLDGGRVDAGALDCAGTLRGSGLVNGDANLHGRVELRLDGPAFTDSDTLEVVGSVDRSGTLHVDLGAALDLSPGDSHVLMEAGAGLAGFFDTITSAGALPVMNLVLEDTGTQLIVTAHHPADIDLDGIVGVGDLLQVLSAWGDCPGFCIEDIDGDGQVGIGDLLAILAAWS